MIAAGTLRIVLPRVGPTKVDEQAVAQLLGDVPASPLDRRARGLLVLPDDVAPLLGVELVRERRRADEVVEEDGELASLAGRRGVGCVLEDPDTLIAAPQLPQNLSSAPVASRMLSTTSKGERA